MSNDAFNSDVLAASNENEEHVCNANSEVPSQEGPVQRLDAMESKEREPKDKTAPDLSWQYESFSASLTSNHQTEMYNADILQTFQMEQNDQRQQWVDWHSVEIGSFWPLDLEA